VRATQEGFHLLFGTVNEPTSPRAPDAGAAIGWAWLYALHARSALARGRLWQAVMMLDDLRDQVIALACARHGLDAHHGRGVDQLPTAVLTSLGAAHATEISPTALASRLRALLDLLMVEVRAHDIALADRLRPAVEGLRTVS
jgi:hypothetical protein